ncbi:MAG: HNH endonuclease [bacterium]|nr:HNH endonuclease [bacterium]
MSCPLADLEIDHIVPQVAGGSDAFKNMQTLCRTCNGRKADQTIDYRSPERRLKAESECQSEWEMLLVARSFGESLEQHKSVWVTCGAVERHGDDIRRQWVFAGIWLPIAELFERLNDVVTLEVLGFV